MQLQIFSIRALDMSEDLQKLNSFLRGHKIIDIEKQFVNNGTESFWSFCIRYINSDNQLSSNPQTQKAKVDYKEVLDEKTFGVFSRLREIRKEIAKEDAVPAYAVFTDYELSEIAKLPIVSESTIQSINGIGQKKAEKYAIKIDKKLQQ